jgi:hypothetical protein
MPERNGQPVSELAAERRPLPDGPLAVLQRIRRGRPQPVARPGERCELCGDEIGDDHRHLVDCKARSLLCACRGCYLLFLSQGAGGGHYRAVPDRYMAFPASQMAPAQWDALQIPVNIAFFFVNSELGRAVAFYPSPAGATECELALDCWDEIVSANPELGSLQPDVEALLVRTQLGSGGAECYLVPVDVCYELVGNLRRLWRGFDGGSEAHAEIESFFAKVRARCGVSAP